MKLEFQIKRLMRCLGIEVSRYKPNATETGRLVNMLFANGVDLVFDVGANSGQYAKSLREAGYRGKIISYEPLSSAHSQLLAMSQNDPLWKVAPRTALGCENGEIDIHIAGNSVSSSALGMLDAHSTAAPESQYVGIERVPLRRLDAIASAHLSASSTSFLKIDTQGYEHQVLEGATNLMERITGVQVELSLVPLYEGQYLYREILKKLEADGFELWGVWPGFADPRNGRLLQFDAVLFRH